MDEGVKRKLVGAAALVVVGLVVLPQITPKSKNALHLSNSVPLEKHIPAMDMPLPKSLSIAVSLPVAKDQPQGVTIAMDDMSVEEEKLEVSGFEEPVNTVTGQAVVWQIQVGSFSESHNAIKLRDSLREKGYKAFLQLAVDGLHTRVFVGPSTQKSQLSQQMQVINQQFKLQAQLTPFQNN